MSRQTPRNVSNGNGARMSTEVATLREQLRSTEATLDMLAEEMTQQGMASLVESVSDLERSLFDPGWIRALAQFQVQFAPEALSQLRAICRLYAIKNPLVKRGLSLRSAYVWGQGVEISARANGRDDDKEQDVHAVVTRFLDDPGNQRALTGPEARDSLERYGLGCDGEVFVVLFTRPTTGEVRARTIPPDEITQIVTNPDDGSEPWLYKRCWTQVVVDPATGIPKTLSVERFYPCIDYLPTGKPRTFARVEVAWNEPVLHVAVNRPLHWHRGIPDAYAAIDWAKAYKEFLEDWAKLMRALARYAWKVSTPGSKAAAVRAKVATPPSTSAATGNNLSAGGTALIAPDVALEAVSKSGASFDAESGRPLAMMVASALDVPVTMLLADPGQTGARATAETLDQPTEFSMGQRRELWGAALQRILSYVIVQAVKAPKGPLKGTVVVSDSGGPDTVVLAGDTDQTIDIDWPDLDDADPAAMAKAITDASGTGVVPPEIVLQLLLSVFGVRNVDELVEKQLNDDGSFKWPTPPPVTGPASLGRGGQDPATAGPGSMLPDDEPDDLDDEEPDDEDEEPDGDE